MKQFVRLSVFFISVSVTFISPLKAQNLEWEKEVEQMYDLPCEERWDKLWSSAKQGNLIARAGILFLIAPPLDGERIFLPGRTGDSISILRDSIILAVHSTGVKYSVKQYNLAHAETVHTFYSYVPLKEFNGKDFFSCLKEKNTQECADIAVKDRLVPSFEDYANEIDMAMSNGKTVKCLPSPEEHFRDLIEKNKWNN